MKVFVFICLLFVKASGLFGSVADSLNTDINNKFLILPFGFYTNETSVGLGLFSQYRLDENSKLFGNAVYTFENQFMFFSIVDLNTEKSAFYNTFKVKDYYSDFYGFGNDSKLDDPVKYRYFQIDNYLEAGKKVLRGAVLSTAVNNFYHMPEDKKELFGYSGTGSGHFANGIGLSLKYSAVTLEDFFRDGVSLRSSFLVYPEFLGTWENFSIFDNEAGFYRSFKESSVSSLVSARFSFGEVHPEKLSVAGGSKILRGYPENRFIDKNITAVQAQYDFRIYKPVALGLFIGAGDVFDKLSDLALDRIKTGYGAGIIYEFKKLIIRVEAATSPEENIEIIITGNRAF